MVQNNKIANQHSLQSLEVHFVTGVI